MTGRWIRVASAFPNRRDTFRDAYFHVYEKDGALGWVKAENRSGRRVWKATALLGRKSGADDAALPCRWLTFEVDQQLDTAAMVLLNELGATLINSGTPGHFHVKVRVRDAELPWHENKLWAKSIALTCGITGHNESGGKWGPAQLLAIVGSVNTKPELGGMQGPKVTTHTRGGGTTMQALKSLVTPRGSVCEGYVSDDVLVAHEVNWDALNASLRSTYRAGHTLGSRYREVGRFMAMAMKDGLNDEQVMWLLTVGPDGQGYEPAVLKAGTERYGDVRKYASREIRKMRRNLK